MYEYYYEQAQEAMARAIRLRREANELPNPGKFTRNLLPLFVDIRTDETLLEKQERIDEKRESLLAQVKDELQEVARFADLLMDELEAHGLSRRKLRDNFIYDADRNPQRALLGLKEAVDLVKAAEIAKARSEELKSRIRKTVSDVAEDFGLESKTSIESDY